MWPVPTWNLPTQCQSLQAAGVKLPEGLSASLRVGATRFAMMGDQSLRKRWGKREQQQLDMELSGGNGERDALDLLVRADDRLAVRRAVAQHRISRCARAYWPRHKLPCCDWCGPGR